MCKRSIVAMLDRLVFIVTRRLLVVFRQSLTLTSFGSFIATLPAAISITCFFAVPIQLYPVLCLAKPAFHLILDGGVAHVPHIRSHCTYM